MCQTRAYKHACGHCTVRRLSTCRFTYASPTSRMPLCSADSQPSVTVTVNKKCQSCLYNNFLSYWQRRIDTARDRYTLSRQIALEMQRDSDWECSESFYGGSNDVDAALIEQRRAEIELDRLMAEFEREQWDHWRPHMQPPRLQQALQNQRPGKLRRRQSAPRHVGRSSLNRSISVDEIPSPTPSDLPALDEESSDSGSNDDSVSLGDMETPNLSETSPLPSGWSWGWDDSDKVGNAASAWSRKSSIMMDPVMVRLDEADEEPDFLPSW